MSSGRASPLGTGSPAFGADEVGVRDDATGRSTATAVRRERPKASPRGRGSPGGPTESSLGSNSISPWCRRGRADRTHHGADTHVLARHAVRVDRHAGPAHGPRHGPALSGRQALGATGTAKDNGRSRRSRPVRRSVGEPAVAVPARGPPPARRPRQGHPRFSAGPASSATRRGAEPTPRLWWAAVTCIGPGWCCHARGRDPGTAGETWRTSTTVTTAASSQGKGSAASRQLIGADTVPDARARPPHLRCHTLQVCSTVALSDVRAMQMMSIEGPQRSFLRVSTSSVSRSRGPVGSVIQGLLVVHVPR